MPSPGPYLASTRFQWQADAVSPSAASSSRDKLLPERRVPLGGVRDMMVRRTLPHRELPTVGAWCFLDHFGPERTAMNVLPHPHTGLQTVTWPFSGDIHHRDSLGSDVIVQPGALNLMTSGHGVAHSEVSIDKSQMLHGLQLWVALPDSVRDGPADFQHIAELPVVANGGMHATVLVGDLLGQHSPAVTHTPLLGAEVRLAQQGTYEIPLAESFEHALMLIEGDVTVTGQPLAAGPLRYLAEGRSSVEFTTTNGAHLLLIGGEPFEEELVMWWNFIGRTHEEIALARSGWENADVRFGHVLGHGDERIPAPALPGVHLKPRRRVSQSGER